MERRLFFVFGDLLTNVTCGSLAALCCAWLLSALPMIPAMLLGMLVGMLLSMVLLFGILMRHFGAMEPMVQGMTSGMLAGMFATMFISPDVPLTVSALELGAATGCMVFVVTWLLNAVISGPQPNGSP
jgi:hypothetical protein